MLSQLLIEQRKKKGLTQQEVSEYLHVSRQSISNWETGKNYPDVPTLISLSEYYEFSLDILKNEEKVKEDYLKSFARKEKSKYQTTAIVLLLLMLSPIILLVFVNNEEVARWSVLFMLAVCLPLIMVSFKMTKVFYRGIIDKHSPFFVPKVFGMGITVNPYHKASKILYYLLSIVIVILMIFVLKSPDFVRK